MLQPRTGEFLTEAAYDAVSDFLVNVDFPEGFAGLSAVVAGRFRIGDWRC